MKFLLAVSFLALSFSAVHADPLTFTGISGGSATVTNPVVVNLWSALGPRLSFDLQNTSTDYLISGITFEGLESLCVFGNLALAPGEESRLTFEFPGQFFTGFVGDTALAHMTVNFQSIQSAHTPEPATLLLMGTALLSLSVMARRKRKGARHG